jgi:hypothetical protein
LQVDLVALDEVPLLVSFKTDRAVRPRWANQMWVFNTFGDMLDLDALQLTLPGIEFEGIKAPRSAMMTYVLKQLQAQALAIAFNVFRCGHLDVGLASQARDLCLVVMELYETKYSHSGIALLFSLYILGKTHCVGFDVDLVLLLNTLHAAGPMVCLALPQSCSLSAATSRQLSPALPPQP